MSDLTLSPSHGESMLGRSIELLHALNTAAVILQQSAHSEQEIYRTFSEQVSALGLRGGLSLLDSSRQNLTVHAVAQPRIISRLLARVERIVRINMVGYSIQIANVPAYRHVIESKQAAYVTDSSSIAAQLIPPIARPFAKHILRVFGKTPAIYAPLLHDSRVIGILNIAGKNLIPADLPAMEAFANHIAIALTNARLVAALRQSAEERLKFSLGIERSSEAIFLTEIDGTITYVNPAFEKLYGFTKTEAVGQTPRILKSGIMAKEDYARFWQTLLAKQVVTGELINKTKDGRLLTIEGSANPIIDVGGNLIGFLAIQHDISEQKRAQEMLRKSESTYRNAIEAVGGIPYIHDYKTQSYPLIGDGIQQLTGYTPQEISPQRWLEMVEETIMLGEANRLDRDEAIRRLRTGEIAIWKADMRIRTRDGQTRWVLDASVQVLDDTGTPHASIGILQDISERKRAEEALQTSELHFRMISSLTSDYAYAFRVEPDGNLRAEWVSGALERITGYSASELRGAGGWEKLIYRDDKEIPLNQLKVLMQGQAQTVIYRIQTKSGQIRWMSDAGQSLRDEQTGRIIRIYGAVQDITERKQRERELEAIASVSTALRAAATRDEMFPIIVDQISALLNTVGAAIGLRDNLTHESVVIHANGSWSDAVGERVPAGSGVSGRVFATKQPFVTQELGNDPLFFTRRLIGTIKGAICMPLVTSNDVIGWVFAGIGSTFTDEDVRILKAIADIAAIALQRASLHEETKQTAADLALAYDTTLEGWARALNLRDQVTQAHTQRVVDQALTLAVAMGITGAELVHVRRGALLHDIGKIAISDSILLKPGPLSDEEWQIMRMHPVYAYEMLLPIEYLRPALDIPYCHHEKWDGSGYPRGLEGEEIPLAARVFAVIDVWDALGSDRPYSKAWEPARAIEHIRAQAGKHFDPQVVAAFLKIVA